MKGDEGYTVKRRKLKSNALISNGSRRDDLLANVLGIPKDKLPE